MPLKKILLYTTQFYLVFIDFEYVYADDYNYDPFASNQVANSLGMFQCYVESAKMRKWELS